MKVKAIATLYSSSGEDKIVFTGMDSLNDRQQLNKKLCVSIEEVNWKSEEQLCTSLNFTDKTEVFTASVKDLMTSMDAIQTLIVKLKGWTENEQSFEHSLLDHSFQKVFIKCGKSSKKINEIGKAFFTVRVNGNKMSVLEFEIKVDQTNIDAFCRELESLVVFYE